MAPPPKRTKQAKIPKASLSASKVLNSNTPILSQDIHGFIIATLSPVYWCSYSEQEKRQLIDLFPAAYRSYNVDAQGKLECPVSTEFLQSDTYVKAGVARFKRDVEAGCWEMKWQEQARKAMQERNEGKFDEYLKEHAEDCFGEDAEHQADEDEVQSGSDWEQEHKKKGQKRYVIERLLRQTSDGSRIEVKWHGYEATTWESRAVLLEDVPDMVAVMESGQRCGLQRTALLGAQPVEAQGDLLVDSNRLDVAEVVDHELKDVVMD